jgi:hypothetical protein
MTVSYQLAMDRMASAKKRFTDAARAALAGDPQAQDLAKAAFEEVESARAQLQRFDSGSGNRS